MRGILGVKNFLCLLKVSVLEEETVNCKITLCFYSVLEK